MKYNYDLFPGRNLHKLRKPKKAVNPIITIVTAFYNDREFIEQTANSILNQTFPYFEWIIIDDGSTDKNCSKLLKEIESLDDRIKIFFKKNTGPADTRDYGVSKSSKSSKYLLFLDSDDLIVNTYLECTYFALETNTDASWAYTDVVNFGCKEFLWTKWFDSEIEKTENLLTLTSLIRKNDFLEVGGFDLKEKNVFEDWNLWLKLIAKEKKPVRIPIYGFWYRKKESGELNSSLEKNYNNAMKIIGNTIKTIDGKVEAIQYPLYNYDWNGVRTEFNPIPWELEKDDKINVLVIIPWMVMGGADQYNYDVFSKLDKEKYRFILVSTVPSDNPWRQKFEEVVDEIFDLTTFIDCKYWHRFIEYLITSRRIDIVFNTNSVFGYAVLPYVKAKFPKMKILDYIHMEEWYNRNGGYSRDSAAVGSVIDMTLTCNKNSENILKNFFRSSSGLFDTVYIGVDEKKYDPILFNKEELMKKYNLPKDKIIVSYIARIDLQKRPYLLLEIIKKVTDKREDIIFVVAGDGPMLLEIKNRAHSLNIEKYIIFLGQVSIPSEIYAVSDITINCSIKEGLALTSYESLSMGIPIISSDVGGQKELINDLVGKIVPCLQAEKDVKIFDYSDEEINNYVNALDEVVSQLDKYKNNARKRIIDGFTIDKMAEKMDEKFVLLYNSKARKSNVEQDIALELLNYYLLNNELEYKWLTDEFKIKKINQTKIIYKNNTNIKFKKITLKLHLYNEARITFEFLISLKNIILFPFKLIFGLVKKMYLLIKKIFNK